mgnify:CR=1 FL=1
MSTYMPKAGQVDRKWYVLDAAGKPLGRVAVQAANLLRGKHKVTFAPRRHDQTAYLCWRRAQPRRTEARSLGTIRIGGTQDVR